MAVTIGIDVSKHQGAIKWQKVGQHPDIRFCYCRATIGKTSRDLTFDRNFKGAAHAGFRRGAYHAFWPGSGDKDQADNLFARYTPTPGDLVPMVDIEVFNGTIPVAKFVAQARRMLELITAEIGKKPLVYTAQWFWSKIGNPPPLNEYPLWVAHYTDAAAPKLPKGWKDWTIWQFTDKAKLDGIQENTVDMNRFAGSPNDLQDLTI